MEQAVLQGWASGDRLAGEMIVRRYMPFVYNLCYRMLRDAHAAEDATQDTFVNVCRSRQRLTSVRDLKRWLCTVATNICLNALRRKNHKASPKAVADLDGTIADAPPIQASASQAALLDAIDGLPERARVALMCRIYFDLSNEDAAEMLGMTSAAYRVVMHRALKQLRASVHGR